MEYSWQGGGAGGDVALEVSGLFIFLNCFICGRKSLCMLIKLISAQSAAGKQVAIDCFRAAAVSKMQKIPLDFILPFYL